MSIRALIAATVLYSLVLFSSAMAYDMPDEALLVLKSRVTVGTVPFPANKTQMNREGRKSVESFISELKNVKNKIIRVEGFCEKMGNESSAVKNSMLLAKTVRDYLAVNGVDNVYITGFGSKNGSVNDNRVEIAIYDKLMDIGGSEVIQTIEILAAE